MSRGRPIAEVVADLLAAPKELAGRPEWKSPNRQTEQGRLHWPVMVGGEIADCFVAATVYPEDHELRFTICFNYRSQNIWRLDYEPLHREEVNPLLKGHRYSGEIIPGPHCHRWEENRHWATHATIPEPLPFRVPLPNPHIKSWESAFRYFLGETGIAQPPDIPLWPPRETLV